MNKKEIKINKPLLFSCLFLYLLILIWVISLKCSIPSLIIGPRGTIDPIKIDPRFNAYINYSLYQRVIFDASINDLKPISTLKDIVINICIFIPFGLAVPSLFKKHVASKTLMLGFLLTLSFELIQLFTAFGGFSFIDLLGNTSGAALGLLIFLICKKHLKEETLVKVVNIAGIIGLIAGIIIVSVASYLTIKNFVVIAFKYTEGFTRTIKNL